MKNKRALIGVVIVISIILFTILYSNYIKVQDTRVLTPEEYAKKHM